MNKKNIISLVVLIIFLTSGVLVWRFWPQKAKVSEPTIKTPESINEIPTVKAPEEVIKIDLGPRSEMNYELVQKPLLSPEEVASRFLHEYTGMSEIVGMDVGPGPVSVSESTLVTEEYREKIAQKKAQSILLFDPVIFAQDIPGQGIISGKAIITGDTAFLIATLKYGPSADHNLKVELLLVNNQWKINNITLA